MFCFIVLIYAANIYDSKCCLMHLEFRTHKEDVVPALTELTRSWKDTHTQ